MRSPSLVPCVFSSCFVVLLAACGGAGTSTSNVVRPRAAPEGVLATKLEACARDLDGFRESAAPTVQVTYMRAAGGVLRSERLDTARRSEGQYTEHVRPLFTGVAGGGAAPDCGPASCTVTSGSGAVVRYHFNTSTPDVRLDAIALPGE